MEERVSALTEGGAHHSADATSALTLALTLTLTLTLTVTLTLGVHHCGRHQRRSAGEVERGRPAVVPQGVDDGDDHGRTLGLGLGVG